METADGAWLRDHISRLCASHRLAEVSLGRMRASLYARCRGFQLGAHEENKAWELLTRLPTASLSSTRSQQVAYPVLRTVGV